MQEATNAPRPSRRALVAAAILLITAVAVLVTTASLARARAERVRAQALDRTLAIEARWVRARLERLEAVAAELLALPLPEPAAASAAAVAEDAAAPRRAALGTFAGTRGLDFAAVIPAGEPDSLVFWPAAQPASPSAGGEELSRLALRQAETASGEPLRSGVVTAGGSLFGVAQLRGTSDGEAPAPSAVVAQRIDEAVVRDLDNAIEADLAFLLDSPSGPRLGASSLDFGMAPGLPLALRRLQSWRAALEEATSLELELEGEPWDAQLAPVYGLDGPAVGVVTALLPRRSVPGLGSLLALEGLLALVAGAALAMATLPPRRAAPAAAPRPVEQPAARLAGALTRARDGAPFAPPDDLPAEYSELGRSVGELFDERQRLQAEVEASRRRGTQRFELTSSDAPLRTTVEELALLVIELRGLARGETVRQAEATLLRARRDLEAARQEIERHGGRVEAWLGHRLLASFDGDSAVLAATRAAAGVVRRLGVAANAFEEPRPPAVALAWGAVAVGVGSEDESAARALAGKPLQQLDELLREAMVGDLLASQDVVKRAGEELGGHGFVVREHAGLRTTQKVFAIDLPATAGAAEAPAPATPAGT